MSDTAHVNPWSRSEWNQRHPHFPESAWHPAWIALTVIGFILWWPIGLALLLYTLGSRKMGCWNHAGRWQDKMDRKMDWMRTKMSGGPWNSAPTSGNRVFDEYRTETLRRLEEEQREFRSFLDRLRFAKDKTEFDQFMAERRNRPSPDADQPQS